MATAAAAAAAAAGCGPSSKRLSLSRTVMLKHEPEAAASPGLLCISFGFNLPMPVAALPAAALLRPPAAELFTAAAAAAAAELQLYSANCGDSQKN
jgi:hypothetical protein